MARQRMIKPEFWTSEQIVQCSFIARLLFIGLWNFCDDQGVHPNSPKKLKMRIFPADDITSEQIAERLIELVNAGLIVVFDHGNEQYLHVTGWEEHQTIRFPTAQYPSPRDGQILNNYRNPTVTLPQSYGCITEQIKSNQIKLNQTKSNQETHMSSLEKNLDEVLCVFEHWRTVMNHPRAVLDEKRKRKIQIALKTFSVEQLVDAVTGCSKTPHNMGATNGERYDAIDLIFRNADQVERFINNAKNPPKELGAKNERETTTQRARRELRDAVKKQSGETIDAECFRISE